MINRKKLFFNKNSGLLDIRTVQKYIETVTNNAGLSVRFDPNAPAPCTSQKVLIIPELTENVTQEDLKKLRHWVLHESLHHTKGPEAFGIGEKELGFDARHSPLAAMWNIFEDNRIEKAGVKDYRGDKIIVDDGWRELMKKERPGIEHVLKNAKGDMLKLGAAWYANLKARSEWSPAAVEMESLFSKHMPKEMKDLADKVEQAGITERMNLLDETKKGSRESLNLAKECYKLLWDKDPDEHIKETKKKREEEQEGDGEGDKEGEGDAKDGKEGEGEKGKKKAKGKAKYGNGEGELCTTPTGETVSYEVFVGSDHVKPNSGPGGTGIQLDYTEHKKKNPCDDAYIPCDNIKVAYYRQGKYSDPVLKTHETHNDGTRRSHETAIRESHKENGLPGIGFANKVRQLLQVKSQSHYQGGKKHGKIHFKNMYKAGTHIPSYEQRVFRQKTESDALNTCVTVLTDLSGSMNGAKFLNAVDSSIILNTSIAKGLRIPVEILAFTEYGPDTFIGVVKEFDEPSNEDKIIENFAKASMFMSANADGDAILWAYERLKRREQKRKIMIVISDGSPAASRPGDAYTFTKKVVAQIEGEKQVEIYAVGIMNDNVNNIYSESVVINRPNELEAAILTLIKRSIFK